MHMPGHLSIKSKLVELLRWQAMGNSIGMLSSAYYSVISPEGAASILGRYKDADHKAKQFPLDCQRIANVQQIYASQLKALGVIDEVSPAMCAIAVVALCAEQLTHNVGLTQVIVEESGETHESFPVLRKRVLAFFAAALREAAVSPDALVKQRYAKFRAMGKFEQLTAEQIAQRLQDAKDAVLSFLHL